MKRRKFLNLVGITVMTPFTLAQSKPAVKCEDCKFYLPDLEVDGYDILTNRKYKRPICKHGPCPDTCSHQEKGCRQRVHILQRQPAPPLTWPPKNTSKKNKTNEHTFMDAKKGDYCFLMGGLCKKIPCEYFLSKLASEEDAERFVKGLYRYIEKHKKYPFMKDNSWTSRFKTDLRCSQNYRLTWLGKLLGRLQIK